MKREETPQYQTIVSELAKINLMAPNRLELSDLKELAVILYDGLSNWSSETLSLAFKDHSLNNKFMPALADIHERCQSASMALEYKRQRNQAALPMPDHLPKQVAEDNLRRINELRKQLGMKMKMPKSEEYTTPKNMTPEEFQAFLEKQVALKQQIDQIMKEKPDDSR